MRPLVLDEFLFVDLTNSQDMNRQWEVQHIGDLHFISGMVLSSNKKIIDRRDKIAHASGVSINRSRIS